MSTAPCWSRSTPAGRSGRDADPFAAWLQQHPGTEVICRDRAYAEAAERGAPNAVRVADRWHLLHILAEHVEKTVAAHHGCLRQPEEIPPEDPVESPSVADLVEAAEIAQTQRVEHSAVVTRTQARYEAVQALKLMGRASRPSCGRSSCQRDRASLLPRQQRGGTTR